MTIIDKAWQQTEPPDHDEPTLRDRLEAMSKDYICALVMEWADNDMHFWDYMEESATDYEQEQLAKVATP